MITPDDIATALNNAGIDTPQKLGTFLTLAALNQQKIIQDFKLNHLQQARTDANSSAQAAIDAQVTVVNTANANLLAAVSQLP